MFAKKISCMSGLLLSAALLGGCVSTPSAPANGGSGVTTVQPPAAALAAMNWTLNSVHRGGGVVTMLASDVPVSKYKLNFTANGNVSVSGGCNQAGSNFTVPAPDKITFGVWLTTKRACQGSLMQADSELLKLLTQVTNYKINGQQLRLNGAGNTLIFNGVATDETVYGGKGIRKFIPFERKTRSFRSGM